MHHFPFSWISSFHSNFPKVFHPNKLKSLKVYQTSAAKVCKQIEIYVFSHTNQC